jgi:hypothetical protein
MPRLTRFFIALCLPVLVAGCQLAAPGGGAGSAEGVTPNAITGDAIEVVALDAAPIAGSPAELPEAAPAPDQGESTPTQVDPAPATAETQTAPQPDPAAAIAPPPKSELQLACEKKGGNWSPAGKGSLRACVFPTRDAGKQCSWESQCESHCLARSGTCAPQKPLLGCNEILQDDGARVTLCIE